MLTLVHTIKHYATFSQAFSGFLYFISCVFT